MSHFEIYDWQTNDIHGIAPTYEEAEVMRQDLMRVHGRLTLRTRQVHEYLEDMGNLDDWFGDGKYD